MFMFLFRFEHNLHFLHVHELLWGGEEVPRDSSFIVRAVLQFSL